MSNRSKKLYLFFFVFLAGVFSTSIVLSTNNYLNSKERENNTENTSYSQEFTENQNLLIDDLKVSSNSIENSSFNNEIFPLDQLKLTGIIMANNEPIALVTYNNITGNIVENDIGSHTTSLLPQNVLLEKIDTKNSRLLLSLGNRKFIQELYPQNTLEITK